MNDSFASDASEIDPALIVKPGSTVMTTADGKPVAVVAVKEGDSSCCITF
jgi:hypothetical protein